MNSEGTYNEEQRDRHQERRDTASRRVPYEALVEVGSRSVGGFEAESVDLSLDGIRMRTAYLPIPGEKLVCRFDGLGGEVMVKGEVIWCTEEARGGEFGVRFTGLGPKALAVLQSMCPSKDEAAAPATVVAPAGAAPGSRVRLHIEGLGSAMRARVRAVADGEVLVGSNLEFLRVGRDIELEDVDKSKSKRATIEHVGVEIDPETNIPQLVVALCYEGQEQIKDECDQLTTAPFQVRAHRSMLSSESSETTPEPTVIDRQSVRPPKLPVRQVAPTPSGWGESKPLPVPISDFGQAPGAHTASVSEHASPSAPPVTVRVATVASAFVRKIGPRISAAGANTGGVLTGAASSMIRKIVSKRKQRSTTRAATRSVRAPKRMTAPPPSGALRSNGKRLFREPQTAPESEPVLVAPPRNDSKRGVLGATVGMMAVVAIYFASSRLVPAGDDTKIQAAAVTHKTVPKTTSRVIASPAKAGVPMANVPLFGATPLSTIEPVPAPPGPDDKASKSADGSQKSTDTPEPVALVRKWGFGEVHRPVVLRLKLDGKLDGLHGSETATGFTITVPNRKSLSSASRMARKDKRIESVKVINYPDRADISVSFKGEVPPFLVTAKGKRVIIEIGTEKKKPRKSRRKKKRR